MRVAILADIHGNQVALEAVLEDLAQQTGIEHIVVAGDLCLNGPSPEEVLDTLQGLHCFVIQGNVDSDVVEENRKKGPKKQSIVTWTREQIGQAGINYLATLPFSKRIDNPEGTDLLIVHANPLNQEDALFPDAQDSTLEQLLGKLPATTGALAFGHYHVAYTRRWRGLLLVDAGSCGMPRDEDIRASYAILTWRDDSWQVEHRRVKYDLKVVVKQLKSCGMPNADKRIKILTEAKY